VLANAGLEKHGIFTHAGNCWAADETG